MHVIMCMACAYICEVHAYMYDCMGYLFKKDGLFFKVRVLIGRSIINGGSSYLFFTPLRYQYITGTPLQNVTVSIDYVPSPDV